MIAKAVIALEPFGGCVRAVGMRCWRHPLIVAGGEGVRRLLVQRGLYQHGDLLHPRAGEIDHHERILQIRLVIREHLREFDVGRH